MQITSNTFIKALSLPEWDEKTLSLIDFFKEKRPIDDGTGTVFVTPKKYGVEMMFDYNIYTEKQEEQQNSGSLFLNQISFQEEYSLKLPFDINFSDSDQVVFTKINLGHLETKYVINEVVRYVLTDDDKKYFIDLSFENEKYNHLDKIVLTLYDKNIDYSAFEPYKKI